MNAPPEESEKPAVGFASHTGSPKESIRNNIAVPVNRPPYIEGDRPVAAVSADVYFDEPADIECEFTPDERQSLDVKRAVFRYAAKIDSRPFSEIAAELGVTKQALGKQHRRLLKAVGWERTYLQAAARLAARHGGATQ